MVSAAGVEKTASPTFSNRVLAACGSLSQALVEAAVQNAGRVHNCFFIKITQNLASCCDFPLL